MKICANPKCAFHVDVSPDLMAGGVIHFHPAEIMERSPIPVDSPILTTIRRGTVQVHRYRNVRLGPDFFLCDSCHNAIELVRG